jgi:hypothetical protein
MMVDVTGEGRAPSRANARRPPARSNRLGSTDQTRGRGTLATPSSSANDNRKAYAVFFFYFGHRCPRLESKGGYRCSGGDSITIGTFATSFYVRQVIFISRQRSFRIAIAATLESLFIQELRATKTVSPGSGPGWRRSGLATSAEPSSRFDPRVVSVTRP